MEIYYNKEKQKVPIKSWAIDIESIALDQALNLSTLPFVVKYIALMADCHLGYGMPIGGVMATKNVVVPNAVGMDIGCGVCSVKTSIKVKEFDINTLKKIMGEIRKVIPVGFKHNKNACNEEEMPTIDNDNLNIIKDNYKSAKKQLGTLGRGNHFIEIQKGNEGNIWIMIHSGSRNLGLKVAKHYNDIAKELNTKWFSSVDPKYDLAFLPIDTKEGKQYLDEMTYCVNFAFANRKKMMDNVKTIFSNNVKDVRFDKIINIAHNYASFENHFGENVIVHRKGATKATKGLVGIIPGSQGTSSYIVEGLDNPESFMSCSHGAGRKMGRKDACRRLNLEEEKTKLDSKNIVHGIRHVGDLDEAPGSYKDIEMVMNNQKDLVKILVKLEPMGVIKG